MTVLLQGSCLAATTRRWARPSLSLPSLEPWWPWPSLWYRSARPRVGRSGGGPGQSVHNLHSRPIPQGPHQCDHHSGQPQKLTSLGPLWWPHRTSESILGGACFQGTPSPACGWVSVFYLGTPEVYPAVPHCWAWAGGAH